MAKLDGLETVLDFLKGLQSKIAAQIAKKVMSLNIDPKPADYKELAWQFFINICS
jgi:mRNA interferase RelE/StbE